MMQCVHNGGARHQNDEQACQYRGHREDPAPAVPVGVLPPVDAMTATAGRLELVGVLPRLLRHRCQHRLGRQRGDRLLVQRRHRLGRTGFLGLEYLPLRRPLRCGSRACLGLQLRVHLEFEVRFELQLAGLDRWFGLDQR